MIVILALLFWAIFSIQVAKAIILSGLLACVISSALDLFFIKTRFKAYMTPEMYKILNHTAKLSDYLIVWLSNIFASILGTFLSIPTRFAPYYILSLILLFIYFI